MCQVLIKQDIFKIFSRKMYLFKKLLIILGIFSCNFHFTLYNSFQILMKLLHIMMYDAIRNNIN